MSEHDVEPGIEVVLDNRKIILAFVLLIAVCGGFFVLGFIEGKRQGHQAGMQAAAEVGPAEGSAAAPAQMAQAETAQDSEPAKSEAEDQPLNWYKNVNRQEEEPEPAPPIAANTAKKSTAKAAPPPESSSKPKTVTSSLSSGSTGYSVQVGAFVKQEEAEIRGRELRSKGFEYRIEPPVPPGQFYFVKVGKYDTRADAVAMQIRLKESGFSCFIKTN
jgi:cell division protein FtsN